MLILGSLILFVGGLMLLVFTKYKLAGLVCLTLAGFTLAITWVGLEAAAQRAGNQYVFADFINDCIYRLRGAARVLVSQ